MGDRLASVMGSNPQNKYVKIWSGLEPRSLALVVLTFKGDVYQYHTEATLKVYFA